MKHYCTCEEQKEARLRGFENTVSIPRINEPHKMKEVCDYCGKEINVT